MEYTRRIIDSKLDEVFPDISAVAIEGAKGVGKTATASQRARTVLSLNIASHRDILAADLDHIIRATPPVFIDEWQLFPQVWERVKMSVDEDSAGGRFLLAGSASVRNKTRMHSGAGRIVRLVMRPQSLVERTTASPTVSLSALLRGELSDIGGESEMRLPEYVDEILMSGFPGIRKLSKRARALQLDSYLERIVDHDLSENGFLVRRPATLRSWLFAYGAATATDATYARILDSATSGQSAKPAKSTVDMYREQLTRIFVLDPVPAWIPAFNPLKRLALSPKHHLVDPALAARIVGIDRAGLLGGKSIERSFTQKSWLGCLFESLAVQSVRVYAEAAYANVFHLRTKNAAREIDIIVEGENRQVVAMEVKLSESVSDKDVRHLNWLKEQIGDRLIERVVLTTGSTAYRRPDGVAVVPLSLLGP